MLRTHENFIEKFSPTVGENAVYVESGVLSVVRIEKVTIEPGMLTFTLKPIRERRIGLDKIRTFSISSSFEFLSYADGRYTCTVVNWHLETAPLKVTYLDSLIRRNIDLDLVVSAFWRSDVGFDDQTAKVVSGLIRLRHHIKVRKVRLTENLQFKGQSWGGAGVMVLTCDEDTAKRFAHFEGLTVVSTYAPQIGDLFRRIRRIATFSPHYNHVSKFEFWESLGQVVNSVRQFDGVQSLDEICDEVIMKSIDFLTCNTNFSYDFNDEKIRL